MATKDRILRSAFLEFTKRGFAGARVDEIASKAKVNKALVYHYYTDKEALFKEVLECKMAEMRHVAMDPDHLAESAGAFFDFFAANPWLARLTQWEALDFGTKKVPNEVERCAQFSSRVAELADAQRDGKVDPALDTQNTMFTLVALVHSWFALPQLARMITGGDPYTPEALKRRRAHVIDAARRILEVR